MANYSPAFGLLGTVVGLIKLLSNLGDPEQFGHGMALAMVTTFYGLFFANFIFSPIAGRLQTLSDEEHMQKEMITIGLVSIAKNESTYLMKEKLQNFVSKKQRKKLWEK
jgi:chemotaxis protein MotA